MENDKSTDIHRKYSLILDNFSQDVMVELTKITMMSCDNNRKCVYIRELLRENNIEFTGLGSGTNRYAISMVASIGSVAVKIALDDDGMIDNRREFRYGKTLYPDVCKVYECLEDGLIAVFEYVTPFDLSDLTKYEDRIREILSNISKFYMIGDVGLDPTNYKNWGTRRVNGKDYPCMLDFAYIYDVSYKLFICDSCEGTLVYDDKFVGLVCSNCKRKYKFSQIRRRVTRKKQEEEIGNITRLSYVLHQPVEMMKDVVEFMPKLETDKIEEKENKRKLEYQKLKQIGKKQKVNKTSADVEDSKVLDDILSSVDKQVFNINQQGGKKNHE